MTVAQIGPYSRPHMLAKIDGRTSHVQRVLIERGARLMLYIEIMDRETLEAGTMSERNSRQCLAWTNSLRLTLGDLGLKAAPDVVPPSLSDGALHQPFGFTPDWSDPCARTSRSWSIRKTHACVY